MEKKKIHMDRGDLVFMVLVFLLIGAIAGTLVMPQRVVEIKTEIVKNVAVPQGEEKRIEMKIPAVDNSGSGVVGNLITVVKPGTGRIYFDVTSVLGQPDTQESGRIAAQVAANYSGKDLDKFDIFYTIEVNASLIEGPSAGAAMSVSAFLGMQNRSANPHIVITGVIAEDGRIMPVGAVKQKAAAAKNSGATKFLVPVNTSMETQTTKQKVCKEERVDGYVIQKCDITYAPEEVNIGEELGIEIVEVDTLEDAVREFVEYDS